MKKNHLKLINKLDKKARILNAAVGVFAHQGFDNSSISEIAERAGVANGTVYLYYENKTDLFVSAMKEITEKKLSEIKIQLKEIDSPGEKLQRFVDIHIELFSQNMPIARFILVEMRKSELFQQENPDYNPYKEYLDFITSICEDSIKAGEMRQMNPRTVAMVVLGLMDFVLMQWICNHEELDITHLSAEIRGILEKGVLLEDAKPNI